MTPHGGILISDIFNSISVLPTTFLLVVGQLSVPNFEKGRDQKKIKCLGDLKSSCHCNEYLPEEREGRTYCVSFQKKYF